MSGHPSELLTISQAAACAGVAERTVRRWVASGRLSAVSGPRGSRVARGDLAACLALSGQDDGQVRTDPDSGPDAGGHVRSASAAVSDLSGPLSEALRLVDKLTQQNLELAGRVGWLQSELHQARAQLALQAPRTDPAKEVSAIADTADVSTIVEASPMGDTAGQASTIVDSPRGEHEPRPWWSRALGALGF